MYSYLNAKERAMQLTMPEIHLLPRVSQRPTVWQITDIATQGATTVGFGGCDVTDTKKFSTRVGPPTCSPPV